MATFRITAPDGGVYEISAPDDATQEQVLSYAQANYAQANPKPAQQQVQPQKSQHQAGSGRGAFEGLARQVGLTGRYALEGVGQVADVFAEPFNGLMRLAGADPKAPSKTVTGIADGLGLPKPEGQLENIVGDATRFGFGAAAPAGIASKLLPAATSVAGKATLSGLAANPAAQIGGGAGSGAASGAVRENGGSETGQLVAGLLGGVAGGMAGNSAMKLASAVGEPLGRAVGVKPLVEAQNPKHMSDANLATTLRNRLSITGGDWDAIPGRVQNSIMADVRRANSLDNLDAQALQRLADFRALEVTPTRGTVTLDPIQLTREKNLAKAGANSRSGSAQGLARVENDNNQQLIRQLQGLEGGREVDALEAGRRIAGGITGQRDALRSAEQSAWDVAKASEGYRMPMQAQVLGEVNQALGDAGMMPFMDSRISSYMQALQENPGQWTPQAYRNLQSMLSKAQAAGGNEAAAAGIARRVLDGAELKPAATQIPNPGGLPATGSQAGVFRATDGVPRDAMDAIDRARSATRAAYAFEDSSPLVRKALSESSMSDPARLGNHLLNSTADEAAEIARHLGPDGMQLARNALATHIKQKALSGAADEVGNVSQKALNSTLRKIGDEKLGIFFDQDEVNQLRRLGRVASYMQAQPAGSAVNNSNSGALMVGKGLDLLTGISSKIPLLNVDQQVDALATTFWRNPQAMRASAGIFTPRTVENGILSNAGRGAVTGGLLASTPLLATAEDSKKSKNDQRK